MLSKEEGCKRTATVKARSFIELAMLTRPAFEVVMEQQHASKEDLQAIIQAKYKTQLDADADANPRGGGAEKGATEAPSARGMPRHRAARNSISDLSRLAAMSVASGVGGSGNGGGGGGPSARMNEEVIAIRRSLDEVQKTMVTERAASHDRIESLNRQLAKSGAAQAAMSKQLAELTAMTASLCTTLCAPPAARSVGGGSAGGPASSPPPDLSTGSRQSTGREESGSDVMSNAASATAAGAVVGSGCGGTGTGAHGAVGVNRRAVSEGGAALSPAVPFLASAELPMPGAAPSLPLSRGSASHPAAEGPLEQMTADELSDLVHRPGATPVHAPT